MIAVAATDRFTEIRAFSRPWWALWLHRVARGQEVEPMVHAARSGRPWRVPRDTVVSDIGLVAVSVATPAFDAWQVHFERKGLRLPRPSRSPVVFLPSPMPSTDGGR
jgi:hypothetical protein